MDINDQNINKTLINDIFIYTYKNDWIGRDIAASIIWEPHILEFLKTNLTKDSVFVDAGSNYGWHSLFASKYCKQVYSFEPQPIINFLQENSISINNINNIILCKYALGDTNKSAFMSVDNNHNIDKSFNLGEASVQFDDCQGHAIDVKTLDSHNISQIDFIKLDVQGYERTVLNGAKDTITKHEPTLIVEVEEHQLRKFGYGATDLFDYLKDLNYEMFLLDYHYPSDFVCVHKNKLDSFLIKNNNYIKELNESNRLNNCLENNITKKIYYGENIKHNIRQ